MQRSATVSRAVGAKPVSMRSAIGVIRVGCPGHVRTPLESSSRIDPVGAVGRPDTVIVCPGAAVDAATVIEAWQLCRENLHGDYSRTFRGETDATATSAQELAVLGTEQARRLVQCTTPFVVTSVSYTGRAMPTNRAVVESTKLTEVVRNHTIGA